jgi:hypothetical protein
MCKLLRSPFTFLRNPAVCKAFRLVERLLLILMDRTIIVKITLSALFLLLATMAFGQASYTVSGQAQMLQIPDHPQHADQHALATEHSLLGSNSITYASGERPLWDFAPAPQAQTTTPLGDVARAFRKEKLAIKKAEIIFEKQGS